MSSDLFIKSIQLKRESVPSFQEYPFSLHVVNTLKEIKLESNVTFIVGENGSGKSTLLEAIAIAYGFNPEGGTRNFNFHTSETHSDLYKYLRLVKGINRPKDGFFFRAESFYNVATNIDELFVEDHSNAFLNLYGGKSLHKVSHGESFFSLFMNRFTGNGIYILDEPEAALSPKRQMSLLTRIHELDKQKSQLIISTHSPILMAYPAADILVIEEKLRKIAYKDTEHYQIMYNFINNPQKMLNILFE